MTAKTDRELLELAAKAAGNDAYWNTSAKIFMVPNGEEVWHKPWNPLANDGDALRLANALGFSIHMHDQSIGISRYRIGTYLVWQDRGLDDDAATRRAIVRAAAAIGETL